MTRKKIGSEPTRDAERADDPAHIDVGDWPDVETHVDRRSTATPSAPPPASAPARTR